MRRRWFLSSLATWGLAPIFGCASPAGPRPPRRTVLAVDVGLKTRAGFSPLVRKGAEIPASFVDDYSTSEDNQPGVTLTLFCRDPRRGELTELGEFTVEGIAPAPRGMPRIQVTLTVIESGMVIVAARDRDAGKSTKVEFGPVQIQEE